ncbi:MAG: glucose-6-phosphate isomerase [Heliobacteriaceae bacterium]|nr:glucose-6-phosphate isomerase [Heliobacteriaceae bacterium]
MTRAINLDLSHSMVEGAVLELESEIRAAHDHLHNGTGPGNQSLGWLELPANYDRQELARLQASAERIKTTADALVVIGIGGSYLGARAAIEILTHSFHNQLPRDRRPGTAIYYAGHNLSSTYLRHLLDILEDKSVCVNVISKSGTTTEPAIAFRVFREWLQKKYGPQEARRRIFATTDQAKGALKQLALEQNYESFVIPDNIGGRFSVLTAVGLLPMAAAGIDIGELMAGAGDMMRATALPSLTANTCYQYAAARNLLYRQGKTIELLVNYEPSMQYFAEWWKQLFGESEGKHHKGTFPASVNFSTDLHSIGQYIQDGLRLLFETVIRIGQPRLEVTIQPEPSTGDGLNYLNGKTMDFVNQQAFAGSLIAHADGGVPNLVLNVPKQTPYFLGQLFYFFEKACAISGYLLGVNPFDQPGVESYKNNMFALLGKPGFEAEKQALEKRLKHTLISGERFDKLILPYQF